MKDPLPLKIENKGVIMFKNILPIEANINRKPDLNRHLRYSAYSSLVTACIVGAEKIKSSIHRFSTKNQ